MSLSNTHGQRFRGRDDWAFKAVYNIRISHGKEDVDNGCAGKTSVDSAMDCGEEEEPLRHPNGAALGVARTPQNATTLLITQLCYPR